MKTLLILLSSSCLLTASIPGKPSDEQKWKDRLKEIAGEYVKYGRVDGKYRWAPTDCMMPSGPPRMHFSQARDKETHGQKLYTIFAKEVNWDDSRIPTYLPPRIISENSNHKAIQREPSPIGQVIVKEAWVPKAISREEFLKEVQKQLSDQTTKTTKDEKGRGSILDYGNQVRPYAVALGSRWFHAEKKAGLFIMMKLDPRTPGTDVGWVYGTVADDLKTVTSVGQVANCMNCHKDAPHDRLFGYPNRGDGL